MSDLLQFGVFEHGFSSVVDDGEHITARVEDGEVMHDVSIPKNIDPSLVLQDHRRSTRMGNLARHLGTGLEQAALVNRAILLVALNSFEDGEISDAAWAAYRRGVTENVNALQTLSELKS